MSFWYFKSSKAMGHIQVLIKVTKNPFSFECIIPIRVSVLLQSASALSHSVVELTDWKSSHAPPGSVLVFITPLS